MQLHLVSIHGKKHTQFALYLFLNCDAFDFIACGDSNGCPSKTLSWLEPNLPPSENDEMNDEAEKLERVRNEVKELSKELSNEVRTNSDLQKEIFKGRKRRDQLCSMMSMIRSETEAVIERYGLEFQLFAHVCLIISPSHSNSVL